MKFKCRKCGATKQNNPNDNVYCSGKCRAADGAEPVAEPELTAKEKADRVRVASLQDYKSRPKDYRPRLEPEKLNWGEKLNAQQLKECGLRSNRTVLPGDWDYEVEDE